MTQPASTRRAFLRSAGVCLALPLLESTAARGAPVKSQPAAPRRMVALCFAMGLHGPNLFPTQVGRGYTPTPYLQALGKEVQPEITVISGLSHPEVTVGHASDNSFLTAAPRPGGDTFRNTISLDQMMVERVKPQTRFPSLVLQTGYLVGGLSYSRTGVQIPPETRPAALFSKLFVNGSKFEMAFQMRRLKEGQSVLDTVMGPTKRLYKESSAPDRQRLNQYYTAVREVEQQLVSSQQWAKTPKPKVDYPPLRENGEPKDDLGRLKLILDLIHLALQTDSTRFVTLFENGQTIPPTLDVKTGYHELCHHGQVPEKLSQLSLIQTQQMECVGDFLGKLQKSNEDEQTLLDRTTVMFGSAMGNASSHSCANLPIVLAGGGFRHGQHLAFDPNHNTPLGRLYVSMMQRLGIETDEFVSGRGALPGLELA